MTKARSNATAPAAKGQLVVGDGTDSSATLAVGSNNQVLTADSSTATGLKWAAAPSSSFVGASAYVTGTQSIANNTIVTVDFAGGEDYDTDSFHSTTTNPSRMTIPSGKGGKYLVTGLLGFDTVPQIYTRILKNGNPINGSSGGYYSILQTGDSNAARLHTSFAAVLDLAATDYVQLQVYQGSGSAKNLEAGRFDIAFLGA